MKQRAQGLLSGAKRVPISKKTSIRPFRRASGIITGNPLSETRSVFPYRPRRGTGIFLGRPFGQELKTALRTKA